jgi:hypothetical protein
MGFVIITDLFRDQMLDDQQQILHIRKEKETVELQLLKEWDIQLVNFCLILYWSLRKKIAFFVLIWS